MYRFFLDGKIDGMAHIDGKDAKHIRDVLRMKEGEEIIVCDGDMTDYVCRILGFGKNRVEILPMYVKESESEPKVKVILYQGLPKRDKFELIIEKCVELGVFSVVPVNTMRSIPVIEGKEEKKLVRWNSISMAAAKQSGRGIVPEIRRTMEFKEAVEDAAQNCDLVLFPYENEEDTHLRDVIANFEGETIGVFIGPEGGFDRTEADFAESHGARAVSLGKRILRTETAGFACLSMIMYQLDK
ncbi:MAG: 16S rRNA (uracil(1498)-N(3))-methyltransferase [Firmicutes bacterium]|nr:16S rRNA (uracil(1498)-N(3))-methyltransferase [Bacillota bacterium]